MNLIWTYLLLGLCALPIMAFEWWRKRSETNEELENLIARINNPHPVWHERLRDKVLGPMLAILAMYLLWPLYIGLWLRNKWVETRPEQEPEPRPPKPKFAVSAADLGMAFSRTEIEAQNRIDDPMGAVPPLPFGHLNPVWVRFVDKLEGDETLYSFDAPWRHWGNEQRRGYVAVKNGIPGQFIITEIIAQA